MDSDMEKIKSFGRSGVQKRKQNANDCIENNLSLMYTSKCSRNIKFRVYVHIIKLIS